MTTSDKSEDHDKLKQFGENLGMAFQIKDDLLDYYGKQSIVGKPVGNDFKDKKITLPLINAFQKAENEEIKKIKNILKKGANSKDVEYIIKFVENYGGIDYTIKKQNEYALNAKNSICDFPETDAKQAMIDFVEFVVSRTK